MGAAAQRERQDELRHHPLRLRRNESAQLKNTRRPVSIRALSGLSSGIRSRAVRSCSAVGFAAVANGGNVDGVLVPLIEEHAVVATAETEAGERRFELLYVAGAVGQVAIHAVENLHRSFAVDGSKKGG